MVSHRAAVFCTPPSRPDEHHRTSVHQHLPLGAYRIGRGWKLPGEAHLGQAQQSQAQGRAGISQAASHTPGVAGVLCLLLLRLHTSAAYQPVSPSQQVIRWGALHGAALAPRHALAQQRRTPLAPALAPPTRNWHGDNRATRSSKSFGRFWSISQPLI